MKKSRFTQSSNPVLSTKIFENAMARDYSAEKMTVAGTVNKIGLMLLIVVLTATYVWGIFYNAYDIESGMSAVMPYIIGGMIGGLILALVSIFKPEWTPVSAPLYAAFEGVFLGGISAYLESIIGGIVIQAVGLTFGTLFALLFAYKAGFIQVTQKFRSGVIAATFGIFIFYMLSFVVSMFGVNFDLFGNGLFGIGISLVIVIVAALNLVLDFDFIDKAAQSGAPKYMEWYGAFSLMVTLIWLYLEILRLLALLSGRD